MTLTTDHVQVPEAPSSAPAGASPGRFGTIAGWVAAACAVAGAGLLAVTVLTPDDASPSRIDTGRTVAEHGSVSAIEHRDELALLAATQRATNLINPDLNAAKAQDRIAVP